jgi:uncharacterized peroxidase-related enzyme
MTHKAHIQVAPDVPGILGPMLAYPETAKYLNGLAETLLRQESATFSKTDRETIAGLVSYLNNCVFCSESHAEVANAHSGKKGHAQMAWSKENWGQYSSRMQALMKIAEKVQKDARTVQAADIEAAKTMGATEADIHDTVLIAAAFCMYNRYVDGLGTFAPPRGDASYVQMGQHLKNVGYAKALET